MNTFAFDRVAHSGWVVLWAAAVGLLVFLTWRRRQPVVGLALAYLGNLTLVHWLSAVTYALPWQPFAEAATVAEGFRITTIGVVAFISGWWFMTRRPLHASQGGPGLHRPGFSIHMTKLGRLPWLYLAVGGGLWILFLFAGISLPSIGAVISTGQSLFIAGMCLVAWHMWQLGRRRRVWGVLAAGLLLPLVTTTTQGFIGYGVAVLVVLFCFVATFYRPRWQLILVGLVAFYGGLSLYHAYMSTRNDLRAVVWGGAPYEARFATVGAMLGELKPIDLQDVEFLQQIDARLNQNYLVGSAARYLEGPEEFAEGETFWMAAIALIPRIVWPGKPVQAGSMGLVSQYTGIYFVEGTSVGMGHPFELYINFGTVGVVIGLALLGMMIAWIDRRAGVYLRTGRWDAFALWFVPGLGLLQVGGSFVELTATVGASVVLVVVVHGLILGLELTRFGGRSSTCLKKRRGPHAKNTSTVLTGVSRADRRTRKSRSPGQ